VSLRVRMGIAAGVAVALAVIAVAVSAYAGTRSELLGQVDNNLRNLARPFLVDAGVIKPPPGPRPGGPDAGRGGTPNGGERSVLGFTSSDCDGGLGLDRGSTPGFGAAAGDRQLVRAGGAVCVAAGSHRMPVSDAINSLAAKGSGHFYSDLHVASTHLRVLVYGVGRYGALMVGLPIADVDKTLSNQLLLLIIIAAAGIALAALLGVLVARTALSPIARFTRQTESIARNVDRLEHERLDAKGKDELSRLAQTFNTTLDALERSVQAQRNLVADASHELRTPIASIRANLQLLRDEALLSPEDRAALRADMIEELDELTGLVGDVVELARGTKPSGEMGDVRLDEIVEQAVERTRRRAPELEVQVTTEPSLVRGEGDRIARAVANLLDNAVKWSPPGGVVEVTLRDGTVTVRDHGPGFREEDLPFVFDRFHRAKEARSKPGSGLGLAIVRQAAEAHGGFVEASNAPGGGALLRIGFGPTLELEYPAEPVSAS
jgi:two-component system, OmpR family, sensor histidine kinase MprB